MPSAVCLQRTTDDSRSRVPQHCLCALTAVTEMFRGPVEERFINACQTMNAVIDDAIRQDIGGHELVT